VPSPGSRHIHAVVSGFRDHPVKRRKPPSHKTRPRGELPPEVPETAPAKPDAKPDEQADALPEHIRRMLEAAYT
jgi:hypothetical protein